MMRDFQTWAQLPPGDLAALSDPIRAAHQAGHDAWPELHGIDFAAVLGRTFAAPRTAAATWLDRLQPGDLYLATACAQRIPGSAEAFEATHRGVLAHTARRFADARHPAEDLVQLQLEALLVGRPGRGPRLGEYTGQGSLQSWLRVTTSRLCIDALRSGVQHQREQPGLELSAADLAQDLELDFIKATYREHFKSAFAVAVGGLDPSERALLKLAYVHGLGIDAIGRMSGVHRATAARRVARAREQLLGGTRAALRGALEVQDAELDSLIGLIGSRLEVSLERLLRTTLS